LKNPGLKSSAGADSILVDAGDEPVMRERTVAHEALFYSFNLEHHVPADHLLRSIDRFVDLSAIRERLRPF
jgi:hypothetical protein